MNYFYHYTIKYWDLIDACMKTDNGFMRSESYSDAIKEICYWYGEDQVTSVQVDILDDGDGPLTIDMIIKTLGGNLNG